MRYGVEEVVGSIPTRSTKSNLPTISNLQNHKSYWTKFGHEWRRSLEHVYTAADLKRNGKKLRAHTHMLRHTFAIEKLNAGASLEDVSLLLAHHSIKITERHYLKFDQRRQDRLTRAAMVDFEQAEPPKPFKQRRARVLEMPVAEAVARGVPPCPVVFADGHTVMKS